MVVFCPNIGLLSGIVLSLVPLLLPFSWQCLMLPVLPAMPDKLEIIEVRHALPPSQPAGALSLGPCGLNQPLQPASSFLQTQRQGTDDLQTRQTN